MRHTLLSCLISLPVSLNGCAQDSCVVDPSGTECQMAPGSPDPDNPLSTTILPRRISQKLGATLTVQIAGYDGATVSLNQGTTNTELGTLDGNGHLVRGLAPNDLMPYALGPAQVIAKKGGMADQTFTLRLYADPSFDVDPAMQHWVSKDVHHDTGASVSIEPVMIGAMVSRTVQVLSQYTNGKAPNQSQVITYYDLKSGTPPSIGLQSTALALSSPVFDKSAPVGFATSDDQTLFAGSENSDMTTPSRLYQCQDGGTSCNLGQPYMAQKLSMLCGERSGRLVAGLVNGSVQAFSDYSLTQAVSMDSANPSANLEVAAIAVGDLDGDQTPDLAIFYKMAGAEAVYLGGQSGLVWSDTYSKGLQSATKAMLGGAVPEAVRLGDLDGDLLDDLALSNGPNLVIATNQADGSFNELASWKGVGQAPNALGDISSIGIGALSPAPSKKASILLTSRATTRIAFLLNQTTD